MKKYRKTKTAFNKTNQYLCKYSGVEKSFSTSTGGICGKSRYLLTFLGLSSDWTYYSSRYANFKLLACSIQVTPAT